MQSLKFFLTLGFVSVLSFKDLKNSASLAVKEGSIEGGLEGLDAKWDGTVSVGDFVFGASLSADSLNNKLPDSVIVKRSFDISKVGKAGLKAEFDLPKNVLSVVGNFVYDKFGLGLSASANSKDNLQEVGFTKSQSINDDTAVIDVNYNLLDKKVDLKTRYASKDTAVEIKVDSVDQDAVVTVSRKHDDNVVSPSISLKTGSTSFGWRRKIKGGNVEAILNTGKNVEVTWNDNTDTGSWKTKATVPLSGDVSKSTLSVSRDFAF